MTDTVVDEAPAGAVPVATPSKKRTSKGGRIAQIFLAVAVVAVSFLYAIPKIANYSDVWTEITDMTPLELGFLLAATALNLVTYWWANMVSIPNLGLWQAAVNNQTSTSVANTMPGGGYISIAVSYEMYRSWGFSSTDVGLSVAVTSVLNIFAKLALPAIALVLIILSGRASGSLVGASVVGVLVLGGAVVLFGLVMWRKRFARAIGSGLGRAATWMSRRFRRSRMFDWGDAAVRFRRATIDFLVERWFWLTSTTIVSHLSLYLVLLLALRFVGVANDEITWAQVLGVFAFGRLLTAVPITPGGVGINQAVNTIALESVTDSATATAYSLGQQLAITAFNIVFATILVVWAFGWTGGKLLVHQSYDDAKVKVAEQKEQRAAKKAAKDST